MKNSRFSRKLGFPLVGGHAAIGGWPARPRLSADFHAAKNAAQEKGFRSALTGGDQSTL